MRLVTGGAWQGKREWIEARIKIWTGREKEDALVADGDSAAYPLAENAQVVLNFHRFVRRLTEEGKNEEEILKFALSVSEKNPGAIISMDQVGCGVVPVDSLERRYRERVGRVGQLLAAKSEEVYVVTAGLGRRIK